MFIWLSNRWRMVDLTLILLQRYGTDYLIAGFMAYVAWTIFQTKHVELNKPLIGWSMALLLLYSASTLSGAFCHNFLSDVDSMNTIAFRMLWRVCVCTVGAAGGVLGAVASVVAGLPVEDEKTRLFRFVAIGIECVRQ